MAAVFMAFSGAGDYSKCTYYLSEDGTNSLKVETRLAQEATAEILASKGIQIDRCVFLLTKKSRSISWEKYVRTDRNSGEISVEEEGILPRLERILPDAEIIGVDVPDPKEDQGLLEMFRIMYDALELNEKGYSISQMAKKTGVNEFRFKRAFNAAGRYSKRRIGKILTELYNTDRDIKRGNIDKDVALELIAISACP